jgi:DNA-binding transcriptional regulator YbjK
MGRSSRAQAEQSRMRIVDAATALFRRHGVDAVSIADIMKAADMTQGGFYKHFTSKDALRLLSAQSKPGKKRQVNQPMAVKSRYVSWWLIILPINHRNAAVQWSHSAITQ